ncbi:hypothetical protein [Streptomyces scabiei]|uniref:hypothetical protein n=1 Tax=Streptomyces scabiei TaxID=1930 RepID=UPI0004E627EF|nr:hypothetical protein [Streptomyces scabiei]KFG08107.1 hypothetical protein IQ61_15300 [Streptomyces scabiei]MDX3681372.1 hypothetical protein [Streptomyces scabiei]
MTLTSGYSIALSADLTTALDLANGSVPLSIRRAVNLTSGTGAGKADKAFHDRRTLAASATEDLDLAGVLSDAFGQAITFARIKLLYVAAADANVNNVIVGNAAANGFVSWVGGAAHTVTVRPGTFLALGAGSGDATGYAVAAGTADQLRIGNSGAGTSVTYDVVLIGASA